MLALNITEGCVPRGPPISKFSMISSMPSYFRNGLGSPQLISRVLYLHRYHVIFELKLALDNQPNFLFWIFALNVCDVLHGTCTNIKRVGACGGIHGKNTRRHMTYSFHHLHLCMPHLTQNSTHAGCE